MLKKIVFYNLIINFVTLSVAQSAESGGMPQLNPEFWFSQIFWLVLTKKFVKSKILDLIEAYLRFQLQKLPKKIGS